MYIYIYICTYVYIYIWFFVDDNGILMVKYPLVMTTITMENHHHAINRKTHYFYGSFQ